MGWWHHGWLFGIGAGEWWMVLVMGLVMVLFWGSLIALLLVAVWAAIGGGQQARRPLGGGQALDVLARRYAEGEISADEYKQMKEDLRI
jgi:uncharacterized membrane protein